MRIFITGATGFVGKQFIQLMGGKRHQVYGSCFPEKACDAKDLDGNPFDANIFHLDIRSEQAISDAVKRIQPDWVLHLAAVSNVGQSWKIRKESMETNLMGTFYLLESIRKNAPAAKILFVSSSDVYGVVPRQKEKLSERVLPRVVNPYAFTKVSGEVLCLFYSETEGLDIIIGRPFPHTGPGQSPIFVCSDWASQISRIERGETEPVLHVGNLDVKRDFLDVRDVVRAYALLFEKGKGGEIYNICSGKPVLLRTILELLLSFSSKAIKVQVDKSKLRKTDIPFLVGDSQKLREETGWTPKIALEQSLNDLLEYWRGQTESSN